MSAGKSDGPSYVGDLVLVIMVTLRLCAACDQTHPHRYSIFDNWGVAGVPGSRTGLAETCGGCGRKRPIGTEAKL